MALKPDEVEERTLENYLAGFDYWDDPIYQYRHRTNVRKMTSKEIEERNMSRKTVRLLKDTPEYKAGAIFQENCDDGNQDYVLLDEKFAKYKNEDGDYYTRLPRSAAEKESTWFEEVEMTWTAKVKQAVKRATRRSR